MRLLITIMVLLTCAACTSTSPKLTRDAQLELNPNAPPPGIKATKIKDSEWPQVAAKLCSQSEYQCLNNPITISLVKRDGSNYRLVIQPPTPVIQGSNIYVLAGQTIFVEANVSDNTLTDLRLVKNNIHPEKTLTISLFQSSPKNDKAMILFIHNPFDKPLKYHAAMMPLEGPDGALYKTDTCPVVAKISATEIWPMPLFQLVLTDFHLISPNAALTCTY